MLTQLIGLDAEKRPEHSSSFAPAWAANELAICNWVPDESAWCCDVVSLCAVMVDVELSVVLCVAVQLLLPAWPRTLRVLLVFWAFFGVPIQRP